MTDTHPRSPAPCARHLGRYLVATLITTVWLMCFALHIPVHSLLPNSWDVFFYPSVTYFMPLTISLSMLMPWDDPVRSISASLLFCLADLLIMALICLPLLFSPGKRQTIFAALSLVLLSTYTLWAVYAYLMQSY